MRQLFNLISAMAAGALCLRRWSMPSGHWEGCSTRRCIRFFVTDLTTECL